MNFLAHCLLARPGAGYLAGAVLGDFVKGPIPESLPTELRAGIRLHRRIDSCSNHLPEMKASVARFHPELRRVAPVLLDIVADHCLTLTWRRFATEEVTTFSQQVYAAIDAHRAHVPLHGQRFVAHMIDTDLLSRYADPTVIHGAMMHVLSRLRRDHLKSRLPDLASPNLAPFIDDFLVYFPLLQSFAADERGKALAWAGLEVV